MVLDTGSGPLGFSSQQAVEGWGNERTLQSLGIGYALVDHGGKICCCNDVFAGALGNAPGEAISGNLLLELVPELAELQHCLEDGSLTARISRPGSTRTDWRIHAEVMEELAGGLHVTLVPDILEMVPGDQQTCSCTRSIAAYEAFSGLWRDSLEAAVLYHQAIMGAVPAGIVVMGLAFRIKQANAFAEAMFEVGPGGLLGSKLWSFLAQDEGLDQGLGTPPGTGRSAQQEFIALSFVTAAGRPFHAEVAIKPIVVAATVMQVIILRPQGGHCAAGIEGTGRDEPLGDLYARLLSAQEEERKRIARDLHDDIGQRIIGLGLGIHRVFQEADMASKDLAEVIMYQVEETAQAVRALSLNLQPVVLEAAGLVDALEDLAGRLAATADLTVALTFEGIECGERLGPEVELAAYRIVQESLTNVLKHASAQEAGVLISQRGQQLVISICDEGLGFIPEEEGSGVAATGILGMKERAAYLGGTLRVSSMPGAGTTIQVKLPVAGKLSREEGVRGDEDFNCR